MDRKQQIHFWYFAAAFMILLLAQSWLSQATVTERIPYSTFLEYLEQDRIASVTVRAEQVEGRYRDAIDGNTRFVTNIVPPDLTERLEQSRAEFDGTVQNTFLSAVLSWVVPILLIFALWSFVLRRMIEKQGMGGMMNVGKSRAKVYVERNTGVTFDDVAGVDEAKAELREIVDFLKEPEKYGRLGAPSRARRACRSFPFRAASLSRCSWAWVPRGCATFSIRRARPRPASSSSTSSMRSAAAAASAVSVAGMTRRNRRSTSFWRNLTALIRASGSCCWRPPTGPRFSTPR
jgi:hypothetical protein